MPTYWLNNGNSRRHQRVTEVSGGSNSVAEVVVFDDLVEPLRDRLEVAAGETAVRREPFGEDQQVPALLGERVVVHRKPPADVREPVLLRAHCHPVGE